MIFMILFPSGFLNLLIWKRWKLKYVQDNFILIFIGFQYFN
jgi:hypothetical protein